MPELPEVETVRRTLLPLIIGKKIKKITLWYPKIIVSNPEEFVNQLTGKKIIAIDRYAKYLLIRFNDDFTVVSHLRMEGKYRLVNELEPKNKHDHVQFAFTDNTALRYNDVRKFGRMQLVKTGTEKAVTGISKLGFEPNTPEFTKTYLKNGLKHKKKNIKNTLLDQSVVAGLGNIYVDEVLWRSKINPLSLANKIPSNYVDNLHDNINKIIAQAITAKGTTIHTYLDANGKTGNFQKELVVYGHQGEPCKRCATILEKIKVNGRGTTFCPHCQVVYQ